MSKEAKTWTQLSAGSGEVALLLDAFGASGLGKSLQTLDVLAMFASRRAIFFTSSCHESSFEPIRAAASIPYPHRGHKSETDQEARNPPSLRGLKVRVSMPIRSRWMEKWRFAN
jgi:hypothetical protein